jgi:predicted amidohydrolase YtcJ
VEHLPLGSDFPIEGVNPMLGIFAAVTRSRIGEYGSAPWFPDQIITLHQAIKGFTLDAAYASFLEDRIGSISFGKFADFVVFDQNFVLDFSPENILTAKVKATVIDGRVKYGSLYR